MMVTETPVQTPMALMRVESMAAALLPCLLSVPELVEFLAVSRAYHEGSLAGAIHAHIRAARGKANNHVELEGKEFPGNLSVTTGFPSDSQELESGVPFTEKVASLMASRFAAASSLSELLEAILAALHSELCFLAGDSPILRLFGGKFMALSSCDLCADSCSITQSFYVLHVPAPENDDGEVSWTASAMANRLSNNGPIALADSIESMSEPVMDVYQSPPAACFQSLIKRLAQPQTLNFVCRHCNLPVSGTLRLFVDTLPKASNSE